METPRTILTELAIEDFPDVLKMFKDPETTTYIKHLQTLTDLEYGTILENRLNQMANKIGYHWTARSKINDDFVGALNLSPIPNTEMMQIGFQLRRKYWNQGLAFELAKRVLEFGTVEAGLKTIYGVFEKDNIASRKVLEKLGFEVEANRTYHDGIEVYSYSH